MSKPRYRFSVHEELGWNGRVLTVGQWAIEMSLPPNVLANNLSRCARWDKAAKGDSVRKITTPKLKGGRRANRVLRNAILSHCGNECKDCGWKEEPSILQHHHREPDRKKSTISELCSKVATGFASVELLIREVDKCDLLCPTCHAMRHFEMNKKGEAEWQN